MRYFKSAVRCALVSLCAMMLTACGSGGILSPKAPDLNKQFDMTAQVTYGGSSFTARFIRTAVGQWQITVIEPYETEGISFTYSSGTASAVYSGIEAPALTADFSYSPLVLIISAVEDTVQDGSAQVSYLNGTYRIRSGDCVLTFEQNGSVPVSLELTQAGLSATITEFSITGEIFQNGADVVLVN